MAATNRELDEAVRVGRFWADRFYRLNVILIALLPLRERREDIAPLVQHFMARYAAETKRPVRRITAEAMDLLRRHDWPGNIRELANTIERAVVLCANETITPADLALPGLHPPPRSHGPIPVADADGFHEQVNAYRRQVLVAALESTNGNHTQAAKLLGLHRTYFLRLLQRLNVRADADSATGAPPPDAESSAFAPSDAR